MTAEAEYERLVARTLRLGNALATADERMRRRASWAHAVAYHSRMVADLAQMWAELNPNTPQPD